MYQCKRTEWTTVERGKEQMSNNKKKKTIYDYKWTYIRVYEKSIKPNDVASK